MVRQKLGLRALSDARRAKQGQAPGTIVLVRLAGANRSAAFDPRCTIWFLIHSFLILHRLFGMYWWNWGRRRRRSAGQTARLRRPSRRPVSAVLAGINDFPEHIDRTGCAFACARQGHVRSDKILLFIRLVRFCIELSHVLRKTSPKTTGVTRLFLSKRGCFLPLGPQGWPPRRGNPRITFRNFRKAGGPLRDRI